MPTPTVVQALHNAIQAVCPITGVSIGNPANKATWGFNPTAAATAPQRTAAQNALNAFDFAAADAAERNARASIEVDIAALNAIPAVAALARMSPAQIDTFFASNVTTLAQAINVSRQLAQIVAMLVRDRVS